MQTFVPPALELPCAQRIGVLLERFSTGGSERVAIRLANRWAAAGREVALYCQEEEGPVRATVAADVAVVAVGRGPGLSRGGFGRAVARMVGRTGPDVLVAPGNYHIPILAAAGAAMRGRRPALVAKLSNPIRRPDRTLVRQRAFELGLRWRTAGFDRIVAMCPGLAEEARVVLGRRNVACLAEPTLDGPPPPPAAPPRPLSGLVLAIGRLAPQKNLQLAIDALARTRCDVRLAILGEGEEYDALRRRAEALGIADRVRFVGFVGDVRPWLRVADALLVTSRFEGYPAAMVEAIAHGLPVVTTPCSPALGEILTDPSFGRVVPADPNALAAALEAVLAERSRPAAAALAGFRARHEANRAAAAWLAMLDATVAARGHRDARAEPRRAAAAPGRVPEPA